MKKNERITTVMTRDVTTVHTGQKMSEARALFAKEGFHHLPVVSGKQLIGMLSASDILGITVEGVGSDERSMDAYLDHQFTIQEVMSTDLQTLSATSAVRDAAELLSDGSFHAVAVVDGAGNLEGLVTSTDLIRFLRAQF